MGMSLELKYIINYLVLEYDCIYICTVNSPYDQLTSA